MATKDDTWLLRRAAFGPGGMAEPASLDALVRPDAAGIPTATDPWDDALLATGEERTGRRQAAIHAIDGWLERMRTTPRPLEERMAWLWHDHFATDIVKVKSATLMVRQVRTLQSHALGSFPELLRAMTVDAAMLRWLDGATSSRRQPNENHARELLELFTVGVDAHTEEDVVAAAAALTGWQVTRPVGEVVFRPRRHDDTRQTLLGRAGVHDVDTVVEATVEHEACAPHVVRAVVTGLLGPDPAGDDALVHDLADGFRSTDLEIAPLVEAILESGAERDDTAMLEAPVPWLVRAERATGARVAAPERAEGLLLAGQLPLRPPDVGGWPAHTAWLSSSAVMARASLAAAVAAAAPDGAATQAAADGDVDDLAELLGHAQPFAADTVRALREAPDPTARLALALCAPEAVVV